MKYNLSKKAKQRNQEREKNKAEKNTNMMIKIQFMSTK